MSRPLRPSLVSRLEQRIDELVAALLVRQGQAHPELAPDPVRTPEVVDAARALLRTFFASCAEGGEPEPAELEAAFLDGSRRAGEAVPLGELLAAYHEGGQTLWERAEREAAPDEQQQLIDLARHLLRWQGLLARAAAESFVRELRHLDEGTQTARRMLGQLLLASPAPAPEPPVEAPSELLERAGVRLPARPVVLAYRLMDDAEAGGTAPGAAAQAVQDRLDAVASEPVLAEIAREGGVVLFPAREEESAADALDAALGAVAGALGSRLVAGGAAADSQEEIPAAAAEARELLGLAMALGLGPGVYRRERLLLEHALSARPTSVQALAALLTPLERRPNLLVTLEAWFAQDFDRGGTAAELAIHRNTLDYRLRRVGDLTGLALDSSRGLQTVGAALLARRLLAAQT